MSMFDIAMYVGPLADIVRFTNLQFTYLLRLMLIKLFTVCRVVYSANKR